MLYLPPFPTACAYPPDYPSLTSAPVWGGGHCCRAVACRRRMTADSVGCIRRLRRHRHRRALSRRPAMTTSASCWAPSACGRHPCRNSPSVARPPPTRSPTTARTTTTRTRRCPAAPATSPPPDAGSGRTDAAGRRSGGGGAAPH